VQRLVLEPNLASCARLAAAKPGGVMALRVRAAPWHAWRLACRCRASADLAERRAWAAMPERRREAFIAALPPNLHEWDAVMADEAPLDQWHGLPAQTLVVSDPATRRPIREIVELLALQCPHWTFHRIEGVGHMAPLTQPQRINPLVASFLDRGDGQAHSKARCPSSAPIEASDKASASTAM
jgi:pimeloyl-ACP methyl ester carboxylesterase